jgi:RNA polymerase sigma-70 factor (ECF subfamily)
MERTDHEFAQASDPALWVDRHGDALFRFAMLRVGDRDLAEELVQETYVAAWQAKDRYAGRSSERTWLVGILKHKIVDSRRRDRARPPVDDSLDSGEDMAELFDERGRWKHPPRDWGDSPAAIAENQEFWRVFSRCFESLSARPRLAFALKEHEGLGGDEICKVLGVSTTNVWVILYRARQHLRRCLELHWFSDDR